MASPKFGLKNKLEQTIVVGGEGSVSPATTVESETTFGLSPVVGELELYAKADHRHGTPANPVTSHLSSYNHSLIPSVTTSAVPAASKIPIADIDGTLNSWVTANGSFYEVDFTYNTDSPVTVATVRVDERVLSISLIISTAFNDNAATISVGHTGASGGLMATTDNIPTATGVYQVQPDMKYGGTDYIKLYISKGTSSQGIGSLLIETQRT